MFPKTNTIQENYDHYHEDITSIENQIQESLEGFKEPLTEVLTEPLTEPPSNGCSTEKDSSLYFIFRNNLINNKSTDM